MLIHPEYPPCRCPDRDHHAIASRHAIEISSHNALIMRESSVTRAEVVQ